jgi:hypothetical protein
MKSNLLFISMLFCLACNSYNNKSIESQVNSDLNKKYSSAKDFFGKEKVSHFPNKIDENNITFSESLSPELGNLELIVINKMSSNYTATYLKNIENSSIGIYRANDTCLLVVNRFASKKNYYSVKLTEKDLQLINRDCYAKLFPIPNFWHNDFTDSTTNCRLPGDFIVYVIDAKAGKYIDNKYLTDGKFMPRNWKNGYSKGYAISTEKNVIIYWLILW